MPERRRITSITELAEQPLRWPTHTKSASVTAVAVMLVVGVTDGLDAHEAVERPRLHQRERPGCLAEADYCPQAGEAGEERCSALMGFRRRTGRHAGDRSAI